jgi:hypothetical protein
VHGEFPDHGLAGTGRCAHQHAMPTLQRLTRLALKGVKLEAQTAGELVELR